MKENHVPFLTKKLEEKFPETNNLNLVAQEMFDLGYRHLHNLHDQDVADVRAVVDVVVECCIDEIYDKDTVIMCEILSEKLVERLGRHIKLLDNIGQVA